MDLDWITLYDYMSIFSRSDIKQKINKFYESFYPLKFKKTGVKQFKLDSISRDGLLGIIATYVQKVLFALDIYIEAEYYLNTGRIKEELKLARMFVEIEKKCLEVSLELEMMVDYIADANREYNGKGDDRSKEKGFMEIKLICSLNRLFEFFYSLCNLSQSLEPQGYSKLEYNLKLFTENACEKAMSHIKLFPEIGEILMEILNYLIANPKKPFNFYSHLMESQENQTVTKSFSEVIKKLFAVIPNKQKSIFVNLNDETFYDFLKGLDVNIPKEPIENYFRLEEEINSIIAQEENFIESILVPERYYGKPEWKDKVIEHMVSLSIDKKMTTKSKLLNCKNFKFSTDFPLN